MNNCPICFEKYHFTDDDVKEMRCGHHIHKECFEGLIECFSVCPLCKQNLFGKD